MSTKKIGSTVLLISILLVGWWLWEENKEALIGKRLTPGDSRTLLTRVDGEQVKLASQENTVEYVMEIVAKDLVVPWSIVFTSKTRLLVSERAGTIKEVNLNDDSKQSLIDVEEVSPKAEAGLMGLVLHPEYQRNKIFYACYAYQEKDELRDKVVQLKDEGTSAKIVETIIDDIPAAQFHAGCRLKIGPDNKLYITTGDATDKTIAQDLDSLGGKILRLNLDGTIPEDNPFKGSPVYSYGHRNPQGLAWHPTSDQLFSTEHGPSGNDGPLGGDEVNIIYPGSNYGWPLVSHTQTRDDLEDPLLVFTPAEAPGSAMMYSGKVFPQFKNNLFFGALKGEGIVRIVLTEKQPHQVVLYEKLSIEVGRIRDVVEGPDGFIYFTSSNQDGRGTVTAGDDKIYRLVPK